MTFTRIFFSIKIEYNFYTITYNLHTTYIQFTLTRIKAALVNGSS